MRDTPSNDLEDFRNRCLKLLCIAGLSGAPQISIPGKRAAGRPIGVSITGSPGSDRDLLDFCTTLGDLSDPVAP
jgi:amidase